MVEQEVKPTTGEVMIVKPHETSYMTAKTVALDATRVQVDHVDSTTVVITVQRPDGGSTTVSVFSINNTEVSMRLVGHTEDRLPAEQDSEGEVLKSKRGDPTPEDMARLNKLLAEVRQRSQKGAA